jgi:hypothetical protein
MFGMASDLDWYDGVARLRRMRPPLDYVGVHVARWRQLIEDADAFLQRWETEAAALGWSTLNLFGCDSRAPFARIDLAGLVPLLKGCPIVALTTEAATIRDRSGRCTRFYRKPPNIEQIPLWQIAV